MSPRALIGQPIVDQVVLTGSVDAGRTIEQAAAGRFIGVGPELGGKDPAYVRADADLAHAASIVDGAFFNSGQSCCAIERIYVDAGIFDQFVERSSPTNRLLATRSIPRPPWVRWSPPGRPTTCGADRRRRTAGARPSSTPPTSRPMGRVRLPRAAAADRRRPHDGVMTEETFGPVIGIMPVDDDDEAVRLMNDSPYGLTASIWTATRTRPVASATSSRPAPCS